MRLDHLLSKEFLFCVFVFRVNMIVGYILRVVVGCASRSSHGCVVVDWFDVCWCCCVVLGIAAVCVPVFVWVRVFRFVMSVGCLGQHCCV